VKVSPSSSILEKANVASGAPTVTILSISLSAAQYNLESDWAEAGTEVIVRHCPICVQDSIVGHGRRRKQAHDEHHDGIGIRRGLDDKKQEKCLKIILPRPRPAPKPGAGPAIFGAPARAAAERHSNQRV